MVGREAARTVATWKSRMDGKSEEYNVWHSRDHPEIPDSLPRRFSNRMPASWKVSPEILAAIQVHLQTRTYEDEGEYAGEVVPVQMEDLQRTEYVAWRTYKSSTDDGDQHYRSRKDGTYGKHLRDASWATVSRLCLRCCRNRRTSLWFSWAQITDLILLKQQYTQYVDKNRHTIKRKAKFESERQWGQIIVFLEFMWQNEDIKVAVIKSYKTRN